MIDERLLTAAAAAVLDSWQLPYPPATLLSDPDGCALLALLCNAGAKDAPELYQYKTVLVEAACHAAPRNGWWIDQHRYARASSAPWRNCLNLWWQRHTGHYIWSEWMTIVFVETGLLLDGAPLQLSFHFPATQPQPDLSDAPAPAGRRWRGQRAQAHAATIAASWWATHRAAR